MLEALELAHSEIKKIVSKVSELQALVAPEKRTVPVAPVDPDLEQQVRQMAANSIREAIVIPDKNERQQRLDSICAEAVESLGGEEGDKARHDRL